MPRRPARTALVMLATAVALGFGSGPAGAVDSNPFAGRRLVVDGGQAAAAAASAREAGDLVTAAALDKIAGQPQATWLGDWVPATQVRAAVDARLTRAASAGRMDVLVLYAIPHRDCGGASAGGLDAAGYATWVGQVARGIRARRTPVVLEPDALAMISCLTAAQRTQRIALLRAAAHTLTAAGAVVYVDAGHAGWVAVSTMASRLRAVGAGQAGYARGVSLNVSNYGTTSAQVTYAHQLAASVPGLHAVVDTGRNGRGPAADGAWCNASGRALGERPRAARDAVVDALLWVKRPGESDGACGDGAPAAGQFWVSYAVGLAQRASW